MSTVLQRCLEKENIGMAEQIVNRRLAMLFEEWNHKQGARDGLHASSILEAEGHFCYREHVLGGAFKRTEKSLPQSTLETFVYGWGVHKMDQKVLAQLIDVWRQQQIAKEAIAGIENVTNGQMLEEKWEYLLGEIGGIADEIEQSHYAEEWGLAFTPDALVRIQGVSFVVEIKGYRASVWDEITAYGADPMKNADFKKAVMQANLYMHMLGLDNAIILIENKATQRWRAWVRKYDETLAAPYIVRLKKLKKYMQLFFAQATLPKRICASITDERAKNCPLRDACFADEDTLLTLFKSEQVRQEFFSSWGWEEAS